MRSVLKRCAAGYNSLLSGESFIIPGLDSNKVTVVALENSNQLTQVNHTQTAGIIFPGPLSQLLA